MYKKLGISILTIVLLQMNMVFAQKIGIIPQPQSVQVGIDTLVLPTKFSLYSKDIKIDAIDYLRQNLLARFQIFTNTNTRVPSLVKFQTLKKDKNKQQEEGYELKVNNSEIVISASDEKGYFNAINSLLQLIYSHSSKGVIKIPTLTIKDSPLYAWRGFMLDESRHFFGVKKVKQILDYMALYKLNKFHWHLTDESAWRLEVKQYPFLTLIGGIGSYTDALLPAQYYTQEEIKDIVYYALQRNIEIIPEIDMPGHATAANRAYAQFSGGGSKNHPDFTFHPAKEGTYQYLTNILKEVSVLFPGGKVHLGGDEVAFGSEAWDTDPSIQALKEKYSYKTNKDVELHFMRRMADSLYAMGSKLIVWDEMAEANLPRDKTIQMWWRHDKVSQFELLMKNGYSTIICPRIPFYFDFVQAESHRYGRKWSKEFSPLELVYNYDLEQFSTKQIREGQILGIQGNLWTERIHTTERLDFMVFPRIAALAESAWTHKASKNYEAFLKVLKRHLAIYKADKIYYYDPFSNANSEPKIETITKKYIDNPE